MSDISSIINVEEGVARVVNNRKLYFKLLGNSKINEISDELRAAIAEGDIENAAQIAHKIKGLSANLSLNAVFETVTELELQLKAGAAYESLVEPFFQAVNKTVTAISDLLQSEA